MNLSILQMMILSDLRSDYDISSNDENVQGLPADASTLKLRDVKESWSIASVSSSQGGTGARNVLRENRGPTRHAATLRSSVFDLFFLFFPTSFLEEICK